MKKIICAILALVFMFTLCKNTQSTKTSLADTQKSVVYLTFDDGPSSNTAKILDTLKEEDVKASFFVNLREGRVADYQRMRNEGHLICNHTASHQYSIIYKDVDGFFQDMKKLNDFLVNNTGKGTNIVRFPGGSNQRGVRKELTAKIIERLDEEGIQYVDWNVDCEDGVNVNTPVETIVARTVKGCKLGRANVVLLHDAPLNKNTAAALPFIIKQLKAKGFEFETVDNAPKVVFPRDY